jgi:hypothetical protein
VRYKFTTGGQKEKRVVMLVLKSRRPKRWAGVATFAALIAAALCLEPREIAAPAAAGLIDDPAAGQRSFEAVLAPLSFADRGADHSAQFTGFAASNWVSTAGDTPTR